MKPLSLLRATFLATLPLAGISHAVPTIAGGNGSFETTTAPTDQALNWWQWGLEDFTINGWTVTKSDGISTFNPASENAPWFSNGLTGMGTASNGQFFVNVEGGVKWRLKASLEGLTIGTSYTVSYDTRLRGGSGNFDISVDTTSPAGGFNVIPTSTTIWATQSFTFVAEAETHTLTISNQDAVGLGFFVDNLGIVETPPDPWTPGDGIWTGGDGAWNTATNWQADTIGQGIDRSATFNGLTPVTATVDVNRPIGSLLFSGANHTLAAGTGSLTMDVTAPAVPTVTVADGFTATIAAALNGNEGLLKTGTGTLVLSGTSTYGGTTEISQGTLKYQGGSFASETHTIASGAVLEFNVPTGTYNGGTTTLNGAGTLRKTGAGTLIWPATTATFALEPGALIDVQEGTLTGGSYANESWAINFSDLNIAAGATFDTVEANVRLNKITGSGTLASGYPGAGYQNLTIGVDDGSSTFNGAIANSVAPANLVKTGIGTFTLAGVNTYTGNTTINDGTLELADNAQLAFVVSDSTSNTITGTGIASIKGDFAINTTAVTGTTGGIWTLVSFGSLDLASAIDPATFTVIGFDDPENDGIWTMTDAKGDWSFSETTGELTLDTGNDYEAWANTFSPAIGLSEEDDDADGLTNFEEYAFGLTANNGSSVNPIVTQLNKATGQFSYTRRLQSKTGLIYTVRSSTTLATNEWTNLVKDTDYTEAVSAVGDLETVTITLTPAPTSDKLFIQVKTEQP